MSTVILARNAMATRFELVLCGENPVGLRAAGEEVLGEVDRLEAQLSLFRPTSEIAHVNARAAYEPVRVTPEVFALLQRARDLTVETGGAFDITIAPLMRCWGFRDDHGRVPAANELAEARARVGMHLVHLDADNFSVRFERPGVTLDLGAIGKGYAIERGLELLKDAGVTNALFHGGTSTAGALGQPPAAEAWKVAIVNPQNKADTGKAAAAIDLSSIDAGEGVLFGKQGSRSEGPETEPPFATVSLKDEALSVSAIWGRSFAVEGKEFGHIIDPRTGQPAQGALLAAIILPSATETDALSTALLTLGPQGHDRLARLRPGIRTLVAGESNGRFNIKGQGIAFQSPD